MDDRSIDIKWDWRYTPGAQEIFRSIPAGEARNRTIAEAKKIHIETVNAGSPAPTTGLPGHPNQRWVGEKEAAEAYRIVAAQRFREMQADSGIVWTDEAEMMFDATFDTLQTDHTLAYRILRSLCRLSSINRGAGKIEQDDVLVLIDLGKEEEES